MTHDERHEEAVLALIWGEGEADASSLAACEACLAYACRVREDLTLLGAGRAAGPLRRLDALIDDAVVRLADQPAPVPRR